ncbi:MAG: hydrogenase formation protein HypD [Candidatus Omnitrophota bacterium]|jgi:hydrogenase expression/formation protein HypD
MKYLDEYRNPDLVKKMSRDIHRITTKPHVIMEICGGQTHSIVKFGLDVLLPSQITLVHGPGCPVCVTPLELIDKALDIAARPEIIFCSFGDMLRVPGSGKDLLTVKAQGGDVRIVYSPLDALQLAKANPLRQVVFFAVGFETTAPGNAMAVYQAYQEGVKNFSMLVSHVLVPPAMRAILSSPQNRVQGFLAAGHVCAVMGYEEYVPISREFKVPIVVTGFEPLDILQGVHMVVQQLEQGRHGVENQYSRAVKKEGNAPAQRIIKEVFEVSPRKWRGVGDIPHSGLKLREKYQAFDAEGRFGLAGMTEEEPAECISGLILQGLKKPGECPAFAQSCSPQHPLGATMVSSEGACAAYYRYRRLTILENPRKGG